MEELFKQGLYAGSRSAACAIGDQKRTGCSQAASKDSRDTFTWWWDDLVVLRGFCIAPQLRANQRTVAFRPRRHSLVNSGSKYWKHVSNRKRVAHVPTASLAGFAVFRLDAGCCVGSRVGGQGSKWCGWLRDQPPRRPLANLVEKHPLPGCQTARHALLAPSSAQHVGPCARDGWKQLHSQYMPGPRA